MDKRQRIASIVLFVTALVCYIFSSIFVEPEYSGSVNWGMPSSFEESDDKSTNVQMGTCTQQERLEQVRAFCKNHRSNFTEDQLLPSNTYLIDDKHRLLMGHMSKGGCTAAKQLIAEANGYKFRSDQIDGPSANTRFVHQRSFLHELGITFMDELSEVKSTKVLRDYFRFMIIRHPMERLVSTYKGKILAPDSEFKYLPREILKMFHAEEFATNRTLDEMAQPELVLGAPTFTQFLTWIKDKKKRNSHWCTIVSELHPCAVHWNAILKIETMEHDGGLFLERLKTDVSYEKFPVRHSHQINSVHDHYKMKLPEFSNVPEDIAQYFMNMYQLDMNMFGYKWEKKTNTATCSLVTKDGKLCC